MTTEPMALLLRCALFATFALLVVFALRWPARRVLGSRATYALWWLPVLVFTACLLPGPARIAAVGALPGTPMLADAVARSGSAVAALDPSRLLLPIWFGGALLAALAMWLVQRSYLRSLGRLAPDRDGHWRSLSAAAPALVGAWRARLVLPADFEQRYCADERALILAHEAVHLRRRDPIANAAAAAALCLFWFNPLAWWALGRFRFDQELACDEAVLGEHPNSRRSYASAMLKSQLAADAGLRLPLGCHWAARHPLKERITMLKRPIPARACRVSGLLLSLGLAAACSYTAWASDTPSSQPVRHLTRLVAADHMDPPAYPKELLASKIEGKVELDILVGTDGHVIDARVFKAEPAGLFDAAILEAARKWTFVPGRDDNGKPLQGWVRTTVEFRP
ncbi:TonB family protein [soil metagenome]